MSENPSLVTTAAIAVVSLMVAARSRVAFRKEQDARQRLAAELSATMFQRRVLIEILDERGITLTKEEAHRFGDFLPK